MKDDNLIYKMPEETAKQLFHADLSLLVKYAFENSSRICAAPDKYLKLLIGVTMILVAIGKLTGASGGEKFLALVEDNSMAFGLTYGAVALIGILELLNMVRMRYHYVKVISYLNRLRVKYSDALQLDIMSSFIWTDNKIKLWPIDSIATFSVIALAISVAATAWISAVIFCESFSIAFRVAALALAIPTLFSFFAKKKLGK